MIGSHPSLLRVLDVADTVAPSDATVLILGETGVGKELLAQRIHERSGRKGPFIAVNCAALPRELFESELFGHERGAFTGAVCKTLGKFELANGGTILLDEVSEIDPTMQAKLLRVLQELRVDRIGGGSIPIDVRVIATSNRSLADEVAAGKFRADLYYRLRVVPLVVPALRSRRSDIPDLALHFVEKFGGSGISLDAMSHLYAHNWPGNVRELEHVIHRGVLLAKSTKLQPQDVSFADDPTGEVPGAPYVDHLVGIPMHEVERMILRATLERTDGHRERAAELMGISRRTISSWLRDMETGSVPVVGE